MSAKLPEKYRYIVVEGPIGAGKTSLARAMSERSGGTALLEDPDSNPFLPGFYQDRARYATSSGDRRAWNAAGSTDSGRRISIAPVIAPGPWPTPSPRPPRGSPRGGRASASCDRWR